MISRTLKWLLLLLLPLLVGIAYYLALGDKFGRIAGSDVFRSAQLRPDTLASKISEYGISTVINLRGPNPDKEWYRQQQALLQQYGVEQIDLRFNSEVLPRADRLLQLLSAMEQAEKPALLHCHSGVDRSGLAALLYRIDQMGHDPHTAAAEVSVWRGALKDRSVGKQFLRQYLQWLNATGQTHDAIVLRRFISTDYVDGNGNLYFYLDSLNGRQIINRSRNQFSIPAAERGLVFRGWAFDPAEPQGLSSVALLACGTELGTAKPSGKRRDVAARYGTDAAANSGWTLKADRSHWPAECCELRLRLTRRDGSDWLARPQAEICLQPEA
jgi:protein tyrosine phosphatase (PTP) superfamily phosphohydrolase (DUF442 family)